VTLDENLAYAGSFSEGAGDSFVLSGGHLLLDGADTFGGGTVDGSNVLDTKGTTTLSGLTIGGTAEWENEGIVTQNGGSATIGDASGDIALLTNTSRGTYDITDDSGIELGTSIRFVRPKRRAVREDRRDRNERDRAGRDQYGDDPSHRRNA
jgi:hypothetical protein